MGNVSNLAEAREARRLQKPRTNDGKGFALLHRKIMDVPFYKDAEAAHLWVHLLLRANHEQTLVSTDVGDVICERGEFITGRNTLAVPPHPTAWHLVLWGKTAAATISVRPTITACRSARRKGHKERQCRQTAQTPGPEAAEDQCGGGKHP